MRIIYIYIYPCILYDEKRKCRNRFGTTGFVTNRNWPPFAFQYVSTIRAERLARKFLIRRGKMHLSYFAIFSRSPKTPTPNTTPTPNPILATTNRRSPNSVVVKSNSSRVYRTAVVFIVK